MRLTFAALSVLVLASCATAYQSEGLSGGFTETQLETNVLRVSFRGNGYTRQEKAEELALLRSAELTLKNGFSHFAIIDGQSRERSSSYTAPTQSVTRANGSISGNTFSGTARTTTSGGQTFNISKPSTTNTIMCFAGKPDIQGLSYNAKFICDSVGQKYGVVCGGSR